MAMQKGHPEAIFFIRPYIGRSRGGYKPERCRGRQQGKLPSPAPATEEDVQRGSFEDFTIASAEFAWGLLAPTTRHTPLRDMS